MACFSFSCSYFIYILLRVSDGQNPIFRKARESFSENELRNHSNCHNCFGLLQLLRSVWQLSGYFEDTLAILDKLCPELGGQGYRKASTLDFCMDHCMPGFAAC